MSRIGFATAVLVAGLFGPVIPVQAQAQDNHVAALQDIEQHVSDVHAMLRELSAVTSPAQASAYGAALNNKAIVFLQHVKKVDGHGPELEKAFRAGGVLHPNVVQARKHYDDMNQNVYPKLSAEMLRVETMQPNLKPMFDRIRNMHRQ